MPPTFRILAGPTASGKSAVAQFLAARHGAEILSIDSMKLYRGLDIGTGKPSADESARIAHHWVDVREPWESASVADFSAVAEKLIAQRRAGNQTALIGEGGTALYLKALSEGLFEGPGADEPLRAALERQAAEEGAPSLHARLAAVDPTLAARLHAHDSRRLVRALEVYELTGRPLSSFQTQWGRARADLDVRIACLRLPRAELYAAIDRRVDWMLERGWLEETRALAALPQPLSREASKALGYRTLLAHLRGELELAAARERICFDIHHFARRQLHWFARLPKTVFVDILRGEAIEALADRVEQAWTRF